MRRWALTVIIVCGCLATVRCQSNCSYSRVGEMPGEVILGFDFPFFGGSSNGRGCDPSTIVNLESIQRLEGAIYTLHQLNGLNTIPGVQIGLEARDTCSLPSVAWQRSVDYMSETFKNFDLTGDVCEVDVLRPGQIIFDIVQLTNAMFPDPNDRRMSIASRFKLMPSDQFYAETIVNLLQKLDWCYVSVVYSDTQSNFAMRVVNLIVENGCCVAVSREVIANESDSTTYDEIVRELSSKSDAKGVLLFLDDLEPLFKAANDTRMSSAKKLVWVIPNIDMHEPLLADYVPTTLGALGVTVPNPGVAEFSTYFQGLSPATFDEEADPWVGEYWQAKYECDLSGSAKYGVDCDQGHVDEHAAAEVEPLPGLIAAMNAVRALVDAVRIAHARVCGSPGFCQELTNVSSSDIRDYMMEVDFVGYGGVRVKFDGVGNLVYPVLDILNYRQDGEVLHLMKVADSETLSGIDVDVIHFWQNGVLKLGSQVSSVCRSPCRDLNCGSGSGGGSGSRSRRSRFQVDGDILLAGMFGVHEEGSSDDDGCGALWEVGLKRLEAMLFAVNHINDDEDVLPNLSLGVVGMDSCYSPAKLQQQMLTLLGSADFSRGGAGVLTSPEGQNSYLMGAIGASTSTLSIAMNELTRVTMVPQVAYSSTSPLLSDKDMFPNFLRTSPSDVYQARAMIKVAQYLGWKYVQTINSEGAYGSAGAEALQRYATEVGICIANSLVIKDSRDNEEMNKTINSLLSRADAKGLLLFTTNHDSRALLAKFHQHSLQGNFSVIAADGWGVGNWVINGFEAEAAGTIAIIPHNPTQEQFRSYFAELNPDNNERNPWFRQYWMDRFKCNLPGEEPSYGEECADGLSLRPNEGDADYIAHVISAVNYTAYAIHDLYSRKCPEMTGICADLVNAPLGELVDTLLRSGEFFDDGDGDPDYDIYNLQKDEASDAHAYFKVGKFKRRQFKINSNIVLYGPNEQAFVYELDQTDIAYPSECRGNCTECGRTAITFTHVDGEIEVPVLFGISEVGANSLLCGAVSEAQVVNAEAMLYALDTVNSSPDILPDVTLGMTIIDTCSSPQRASTAAMLALSGAAEFGNHPGDIMATVGALLSGVSKEMLRVTGAVQQTQVSFGSTSIELENRDRYPYFLRTVPVDDKQAEAMVSLLLKYRWFYVSTVKSNSTYGLTGMRAFMEKANAEMICAATQLTIPANPTNEDYVEVMAELSARGGTKGANVVVLFTSHQDTRELLKHAKAKARTKFTWVAPDSWGIYSDVVEDVLDVAKGAFTLVPFQEDMPQFYDYLTSLTPANNARNPWFRYLWESVLDCRLDETSTRNADFCEDPELVDLGSVQETRLRSALSAYAMNAVLAIAKGLHDLHVAKCPTLRLCPEFYNASPQEVFDAIRSAELVGQAAGGQSFSFLRGAGAPKYTIMHYVSEDDAEDDADNAVGRYREIGKWDDGSLRITGQVQHYDYDGHGITNAVRSACPDACRECYTQGVAGLEASDKPPLVFNGDSIWGVIIIAVVALGILFCLIIFIYFLVEYRHPVVKGASSSLSFFLLLGISCLLLENFAFMFEPTRIVCGCRRFGLSFFHALVWCALLCKAIRILRIGDKAEINSPVAFVGPWSQTFLLLAFLLVQVVLVGEWLILDPPAVSSDVIETGIQPPYKVVYYCGYDNVWMVLSLVYVFLLMFCTFWIACGVRKYSSLLNEGAFILFTTVASVFVMVAWILVYTLAPEQYRDPALCVGITTNAIVILGAIFLPKISALTSTSEKPQDNAATGNDMGKSYVYSNPDVNKDDEVTSF